MCEARRAVVNTSLIWRFTTGGEDAIVQTMNTAKRKAGGRASTSGWRRSSSYAGSSLKSARRFASLTRRKRPNPRSLKRLTEIRAYYKMRTKFLKQHPTCPVTRGRTTDIHHTRGRSGRLLNDRRFWLAVSREGHKQIHLNPKWAREKGFLCPIGQWGVCP